MEVRIIEFSLATLLYIKQFDVTGFSATSVLQVLKMCYAYCLYGETSVGWCVSSGRRVVFNKYELESMRVTMF